MKSWIFVTAVVSLLLITGIVFVSTMITADQEEEPAKKVCCSSKQSCSQENNCGSSGCGARIGKSCGCRG